MNSYRSLHKQVFTLGEYSIVPIRFEDRIDIMNWRNEQIYHLRQSKPLTMPDQEQYFQKVVVPLFDQEQPGQILFSYLENEKCIGYGGLVHINWVDMNAEISFVMDTSLEKDDFQFHWSNFLKLIEEVAFKFLKYHKLYVYAFDLRPHLYKVLVREGYFHDATLNEHCHFNGKYIDVVIHSKLFIS